MKTVNKNLLKKVVATSAALALPLALIIKEGQSASANGQAKIKVLRTLSITKDTDLEFGEVYQGEAAKTIANNSSSAASFSISGHPAKVVDITLSNGGTVRMDSQDVAADPDNNADHRINVALSADNSQVTLSGAAGSFGIGAATVKVGGTTDAISATQQPQDYVGTFTVTVLYN